MRLSLDELTEMARKCRKDIVRMTNAAGSGHPGGSLSAIDLMVALYGTNLSFRVDEPEWEDRDRFILSKGHASPAMYAVLHQMGILAESDIMSFRKLGSICQGHVDMRWTAGVDFSGGSLGMGMSFGLGCAIAAKMDGSNRLVWVMVGDGETQEGQVWEAAMAASHHNATNLKVIIDRNGIQNDSFIDAQMEIGDIAAKFSSFGWDVKEVDGHDLASVVGVIDWAANTQERPVAIVANTIKGKGVSFMENNPAFHGKAPTDEELGLALEELA
ncbi:MAG: transketolase [Candidatus Thalassarchaeaceae archaeon]|jgi:transketolase|nr:transketolase [Euryarchaeota archaeon]MDP6220922.1 transketolase [Candidatus Thalassarchaeaceae archaeon]MDP7092395.1 transketolase [Candidatus Thalassarchaeaceae archaeon]MDP7256685.1 transketolase [Candidatus Thalassarchaeaceae archaeon]MDP7446625.1 transketolase [Candidatus Thalassarchaeaceae archaeon]|tara:strand:+ start:66 stop:881 length:816 start_codon:yes stop_codon:yes gene_type:complete